MKIYPTPSHRHCPDCRFVAPPTTTVQRVRVFADTSHSVLTYRSAHDGAHEPRHSAHVQTGTCAIVVRSTASNQAEPHSFSSLRGDAARLSRAQATHLSAAPGSTHQNRGIRDPIGHPRITSCHLRCAVIQAPRRGSSLPRNRASALAWRGPCSRGSASQAPASRTPRRSSRPRRARG